jgi:membrane protein DedA with SNARE-associated domain
VLALLLLLAHDPGNDREQWFTDLDGPWPYVVVSALLIGDAVFPVLPGETTLNAAGTLAAAGQLELVWVMVAGAFGAVLGDSACYGMAHLARSRIQSQVDTALRNDKVQAALTPIGSSSRALILLGRYVPGMRFVVNATLGLSGYPYRSFLPWSALAGTLWSLYISGVAYLVGTKLSAMPLASVVIAGLASSVAVAVLFVILARRYRRLRRETPEEPDRVAPQSPTDQE